VIIRRSQALQVRREAAALAFQRQPPAHINNGEEADYRSAANQLSYIANFSKGLHHNALGEVVPEDYRALLHAIDSQQPQDFEAMPQGVAVNAQKFTSPQAGLSFDLEGPDSHSVTLPPAPRIDSAEMAAEMAELYWMALLRDVNFTDYLPATLIVAQTAASMSAFSGFTGPKIGGVVTPESLFRGFTPGDLIGPYISQFLLQPIKYGTLRFTQRQQTAMAGKDYMMDFASWLDIQNGAQPASGDVFDPTRRYIRNGRDMATYVHFDQLYEAYLNACLYLLSINAPFDPGNPYTDSKNQKGFATFGGPHILSLVTEVATRALKAVWYQKWFVHRRLRPEAFGGLVHNQVKGAAQYPLHPDMLATGPGTILDRIHTHNLAGGNDTYLLPMAFPEGSPTHPAYGAGHATVAGACTTILKAWFDESFVLSNPVVPNATGTALVAYGGPGFDKLTVSGELNKVAANVAIGRNMGGVHWRSDYTESLKLGEAVAIGILQEQKLCYNEYQSMSVTKFDGTMVKV